MRSLPGSREGDSKMRRITLAVSICLVIGSSGGRARAQYIYIDANGDEASTAADQLASKGNTTVDVWIRTDRNKDGSTASYAPDPTEPLSMFSYEIVLHVTKGTVKWGEYQNLMPSMDFELGTDRSPTDFYTGYLG